jgi:hypothetical protein
MYDKGHGVPMNRIAAYKWLNLAAAHAPIPDRDRYTRMRDAVASKMTNVQVDAAQWDATTWAYPPPPPPAAPPR